MNGLLTTGIPLGVPIQILTSGLSYVPETEKIPVGGAIPSGVSTVLLNAANAPATSSIFALPSDGTTITWSLSAGAGDLEGSLDGVHFSIIDSASSAGARTLGSNVTFARISITSGVGVTARLVVKREKL